MLLTDNHRPRNRYVGVVICVVVGIGMGIWYGAARSTGRSSPPAAAVRSATQPAVTGIRAIGTWLRRQTSWVVRARQLEAENQQLRIKLGRLEGEAAGLREADATATRLREQIGFATMPTPRRLAADIIALRPSPYCESVTLNRGSSDGIRNGMVVCAPQGVLGRVFEVAPGTCGVLLLTDTRCAIGSVIQRADSRVTGVCRGTGAKSLSMVYVDHEADVRVGDAVVSSGMGEALGIFPKGLPIGRVTRVGDDMSGAAKVIDVAPAAAYDRIEEAYILL